MRRKKAIILIILIMSFCFIFSLSLFSNDKPIITSIQANPVRIDKNETTQLTSVVTDDSASLFYQWTSDAPGNFNDPNIANPLFTAAGDAPYGECILTLKVSDEEYTVYGSILIHISVDPTINRAPEILSSFQSAMQVATGGGILFIVQAVDPEGAALSFEWSAEEGVYSDPVTTVTDQYTESRITWTAPGCSRDDILIKVVIRDDQGFPADNEFLPVSVTGGLPCPVQIPVFNPPGGKFNKDIPVALSCQTSGATIRFTTDGTEPDGSSSVYSGPIQVAGNGTQTVIKAYATKVGMSDSPTGTEIYSIEYEQVAVPVMNPPGGTYNSDQNVVITCATGGAAVYYTTDGSVPNESSTVYIGPVPVTGAGTEMTIKAYAVKQGMTDSAVKTETYSIQYGQVATPSLNPPGGAYDSDQTVAIACATDGATIRYTTDGSVPNGSSTVYTGPVPVAGAGTEMTIKAYATKQGMADSTVGTGNYGIHYWVNEGAAGFSSGGAAFTSVCLDNTGIPYAAYSDAACARKAVVRKYETSWVTLGSEGFSAASVSYLSIGINNGTPYLAFSDSANGNRTTVMKYDGYSWIIVGNAGFSAGPVYCTSLCFDNGGTPYIGFEDGGHSGKATVMKYNGSVWELLGDAGFSAGIAGYTSLYVDGITPYIAYSDWGNSGRVTVKKWNGSSWVTVGSAGFSAGQADSVSLKVDGGTPYVAYKDHGHSGKATVMKFNGNAWELVGSAGFSAGIAEYTSLFIYDGTPYIAYTDNSVTAKATVQKYNGNAWELVGKAGFSAGITNFISLSVYDEIPYVAYEDSAHSNKATVMKHK